MKRLFVRPSARGLGLGRALVSAVLSKAATTGYAEVVLDTLPSMAEAQRLYEEPGFRDIPPYRPNPVPGTRCLSKSLPGTPPGAGRPSRRPSSPTGRASAPPARSSTRR